jgi:hypothetical protein
MSHAPLDRLEGDVRDARRRLKSDLEVLRAPETFSSFKEEVLDEARQSRDDIVANVKEAATGRAERLIADIKERAAANPVAVGAIAAGVAWRILRKPPITTMLVGYGLISLWRRSPANRRRAPRRFTGQRTWPSGRKSKSSNGAPKPAMPSHAPPKSSFQQ